MDLKNQVPTNKVAALLAGKTWAIVAAGVAAVLCICYASVAFYLSGRFLFGTSINGVDCSAKTEDEARAMLEERAKSYSLQIQERNNKLEYVSAEEIGLSIDVSEGLRQIKQEQNPAKWGLYLFKGYEGNTEVNVNVNVNDELLENKILSLECFKSENMSAPVNAKIEYSEESGQFAITPEDNGTTLKTDEAKNAVKDAVLAFKDTMNLDEDGLYIDAQLNSENENLKNTLGEMNKYTSVSITYNFGANTEVVDKDRIKDWISSDENGNVSFNNEKVDEFVSYLARTYNTMGITRDFRTSYNNYHVTVKGGDYGWWLNKNAERDSLIEAIKAGENITKEPVYLQRANGFGNDEIGNTYAEVNLGTQHMFFYKDGAKVLETDFVSGRPSNGHATPVGTYGVTYKERNAILRGENYATPVDYWMPFNLDIGFHDANWQSAFGGKRYLTHGSHGCINLPPSMAEKLFSYISKGDPVIVYNYVPGASSQATEAATEATTAQAPQTTTQAPQTTTQAPQATTQAPQTTTQAPQTTTQAPQTTTQEQTTKEESTTETTTEKPPTMPETAKVNVVIDDNSPDTPELN